MIDAGEVKRGMTIEMDGEIYKVLEFRHIKLGRGSAQIRLKLRALEAGHIVERSFQASEKFIPARLEHRGVQYLYHDADLYYFMDTETFEQIALSPGQLGEAAKYVREGMNLEIVYYGEKPMGIDLPAAVELKVAETGPGFKGDTATGGGKPATLETGIVIQVPFFINTGDMLKVDTRTGQYLERAG